MSNMQKILKKFVAALCILLCAGCASSEKLVQTSASEAAREAVSVMWLVDSVTTRDSIFVRMAADTIFVREVRWRERLVRDVRRDTLRDTLRLRETRTEVREKIVPRVPRLFKIGTLAVLILFITSLYWLGRAKKWL